MKILILVSSLTAGGEQRVASLWTKGFVERGHKVSLVLGCSRHLPHTYEVPSNVSIYHLQNMFARQLFKRFGIACYYLRNLRKIIRLCAPDIIISLHHPWTEWAYEIVKDYDIPIISTEHTTFERPASAKPISHNVLKWKYESNKRYSAVTVLTAEDKKCLDGYLSNVYVLPNPLTYRPVLTIPPKEKIILAVGQLHSWQYKGLDLLIRAWGKIANKYPDWKLQIAGRDRNNSKALLQKIADEVHLGKQLEFLGFIDNMLPLYKQASVFVLSSRYEGFGVSLIEAMSQGCACIACDYKGRQREIIPQDDQGILCQIDNVKDLSAAIHKMLSEEDYRKIIQQNGIARSKHYCLENIMEKWEEIFCKIMA